MKRRHFNQNILTLIAGISALQGIGCRPSLSTGYRVAEKQSGYRWKLSLAQWSLHRSIQSGDLSIFDFSTKAKSLGFEGLEYVSQLYAPYLSQFDSMTSGVRVLADNLKDRADSDGMQSLIMMVDNEGDLAIANDKLRAQSVENHYKWIDLISEIGGNAIRVNLFGDVSKESMTSASVQSLIALADYAEPSDIDVIVENHGGWSSDPDWLVSIMQSVNKKNVGLLPDFGNFCIKRQDGDRWESPCTLEYPDKTEAIKLMMPYARGVSAKSYAFDEEGHETTLDYKSILEVIKQSGYQGYIGVEYEGIEPEESGILATKKLLENLQLQL